MDEGRQAASARPSRRIADLFEACVPPHGFERDAAYRRGQARTIRAHETDLLMPWVGAPTGETLADAWSAELPPCWARCIGQAIKAGLGPVRRAPPFVQRLQGEWLWRLAQEPRRLARRYLAVAGLFPLAVAEDLLGLWPAGGGVSGTGEAVPLDA